MTTSVPDAGERAFRALLRLYPQSFRARFGEEMTDFYLEQRMEPRHRGSEFAVARLWLHLVVDVALSAPVEHWRALTHSPADHVSWASPDYPPRVYPMETLRQDIRYALRSLARHPGFAAIAALTLALGIGATTSIFSVVNAVLLRPLPWPNADRMVVVWGTRGDSRTGSAVYLDYLDWRAQNTVFEELGLIRGQSVNLTGGETPERLTGSFVTASSLRMFGGQAIRGRLFTDAETEVATREPVAVITAGLWRTRFGSREDILGQSMVLNGQTFTIVGVAPFQAPLGTPDVWMPIGYIPNAGDLQMRGRGGVLVIGRLKSGVSHERAQQDMDVITQRLAEQYAATNAGTGANVQTLKDVVVGDAEAPLLLVLASVATVLLIACANVANLQLARAAARRRELSVRAALGAGRRRLVRQLLTENLVLSLAGGTVGVAAAYYFVPWFAPFIPNLLSGYGVISVSKAVLAFAALLTVGSGLVFGVAPAWQASRTTLHDALTARGASGGIRIRAHQWFVVGQIALCVVLLMSAGLLTRSLMALAAIKPGFEAEHLLTLQFRLPVTKYDTEPKIADMFARTIAEIRAVPGVEQAALVRATPLNGNGERFPYETEGTVAMEQDKLPQAHLNIVSPGYFETMRLPRTGGRDFTMDDRTGSTPVVIVNETLARKLAPTGTAVGKRVRLMTGDAPQWLTVVGVAGNAKHFQINDGPFDQAYVPFMQRPLIFTEVVVRTPGDPMTVANAVRAAIWRVDRDQPVWGVRPLTTSIVRQLGPRQFTMQLLAAFAVLAVVLAVIGVYGVTSYSVARRSQEMGIRMALGARNTQVVGLVVAQGMRTVGLAIAIGVVIALGATRLLESQLYGVEPTDPATLVAVSAALALVALAACVIPARRASRVDPVAALRAD